MKIELDVLRSSINRLLDHVEEMKGNAVDVDEDLYWFIPRECLHDPANDPSNLTLGSLGDDWEEVSAVARGEKESCGYVLVWASSLLRALGDRTP